MVRSLTASQSEAVNLFFSILQQRVDAVEEVLQSHSHILDKLRITLRGLPDLVKGLARIQYGKVLVTV